MRFSQCPYCGTAFSRTIWRHTEQAEYECPQCGNCYDVEAFENEGNAKHQESEDILAIPNLLNNLEFHDAEKRLEELEKKYPDNPKVFFLKVLAANCITYIPDESSKNVQRWIPTLNNINEEPLSSMSAYKKCLELAKGDEKEHFQKTFDFIEKKRAEVLEDYSTGKYNYDVFISTKVSKLDFSNPANPVPVLDSVGDPIPTEDAKLASQIYDQLRHDNPRLRVFYSEREKDQMAGQRFENVIFSALHSAKAFILVANDINHINWRWVKNEWKRYLYLMDPSEEGYKNRHIIVAGKGLAKTELPFELKNRQFVDFGRDAISGPLTLIQFVNTSLQSGLTYERMTAKTFDSSVAVIDQNAIQATQMQSARLGAEAKEINIEVEEEARYWIKQTNDDEESARWDAFRDLRSFVEKHPDAYAAKIHLLLDQTPFRNIDDYFSRCENVYNKPEIAKEFFNLAKKEDAVARLDSFGRQLAEAVKAYAEKDLGKLVKAAEVTIAPNLAYLSKDRLKEVFDSYDRRVERLSRGFQDLTFISQYFDLHLFYTNKDPKKYISTRERLLFSYDDPKIVRWISDSIIKVDRGNVTVLWTKITQSLFGKILTIAEFCELAHEHPEELKGDLAGNKAVLDLFGSLFLYAPQEDKCHYLYSFLSVLIAQEKTYAYQGSEAKGDEGLSGYDLFKKYIGFDLSGLSAHLNKPRDLEYYYEAIRGDAYLLKTENKITPVDEFLCRFGVELHKHGQFNLATDIYNMYLAQQSSATYIDTLMIRYYQILAESGCISPDEVAFSSQKFDCISIGVALAKYDEEEYDEFRNYITHLERDRARYQASYESLKKVFTMRPKATLSALASLIEVQNEFNRQFKSLKEGGTPDRIVNALKNDLSSEAKTLQEEIDGLTKATEKIKIVRGKDQSAHEAVIRMYSKAQYATIDKAASQPKSKDVLNSSAYYSPVPIAPNNQLWGSPYAFVKCELEEYYRLYEQWGDAGEVAEAKQGYQEALEELQKKEAEVRAEIQADRKQREKQRRKEAGKRRHAKEATIIFLVIFPILLCLLSLFMQVFQSYIVDLYRPLYTDKLSFWHIFGTNVDAFAGLWDWGHEGLLSIFNRGSFEFFDFILLFNEDNFLLFTIIAFAGTFGAILIASWLGFAGRSRVVAIFTFIAVAPLAAYGVVLIAMGLGGVIMTLVSGCYTIGIACSSGCEAVGPMATWLPLGIAFLAVSAMLTSGSLALLGSRRYKSY
ncbi:MAG: TIR domain-containing protein [Bacilli bacterium]|nr:TIR domain-containing protein [Bacilli bacterium]